MKTMTAFQEPLFQPTSTWRPPAVLPQLGSNILDFSVTWYRLFKMNKLSKASKESKERYAKSERGKALGRIRSAKWKKANKEKTRRYRKSYEKKNRAKINIYRNSRHEYRYQHDPEYRIRKNLRTRVSRALKGINKSAKTVELLGCSIPELQEHLEKQFKPGMEWSNYGKWHVDHIMPCAFFDLTNPAEQKKCFHYTNLQPLWAAENLKKHASLPRTAICS